MVYQQQKTPYFDRNGEISGERCRLDLKLDYETGSEH